MANAAQLDAVLHRVMTSVSPMLGIVSRLTSLPTAHFGGDAYIVGFIAGASIFFARAASNDSLGADETGLVMFAVVDKVFGNASVDFAKREMERLQRGMAAEFGRGVGNGQKTVYASLGGIDDLSSDPDIAAAIAERGREDSNAIQEFLLDRLFYKYVFEKYGQR